MLTVKVKNKYSEQLSRIFERAGGSICVTELSPLFPVEKPDSVKAVTYAKEFLAMTNKKKAEGCEAIVVVTLPGLKPQGDCRESISSKKLLAHIAKICGRN